MGIPKRLSYFFTSLWDVISDPKQLVADLDNYIVGQQKAKKMLSVMVFQRHLREMHNNGYINMEPVLTKDNLLLIGSTGSGKTHLMKSLSKLLKIPVTICDMTGITSSGYHGGNVENLLIAHINNCKNLGTELGLFNGLADDSLGYEQTLKNYAESGILYIDEFDKCRSTNTSSGFRDINGESVQQELLKIFEGQNVYLEKCPLLNYKYFNTENLIIVAGGAFVDLPKIILKRLNGTTGIGFSSDLKTINDFDDILQQVRAEDLISYGYLPELIGRIPLIATLNRLTKAELRKVLLEVEDSILWQFESMFLLFGIELIIEDSAIDYIIDLAYDMHVGARALKSMLSQLLSSYQYNLFDYVDKDKIVITKQDVENIL